MIAATTVCLLLVLLFAGVPVAFALIGSSLCAVLVYASDLLPALGLSVMSTVSNYILLAIPLFILAGEIAVRGKLLDPLVELAQALLAPVPGGTGVATVGVCMFFAGITGSTAAEAAAVGTFGLPMLQRAGYPKPFSTAVIACASTFGILIPPSLTDDPVRQHHPGPGRAAFPGRPGARPPARRRADDHGRRDGGGSRLRCCGSGSTSPSCARRWRARPGSSPCRWSSSAASTRVGSRPPRSPRSWSSMAWRWRRSCTGRCP